jgi:adenylate kinase family enzyme
MLIGLVGCCAAGKSTMGKRLTQHGYAVRQIAQEHSYVKDMWLKITHPDVLIFLDVSYDNTILRKQLNWTKNEYQIQLDRLAHARAHADLIVDTNDLSPDEVFEIILSHLHALNYLE